jgi:hypothetical protein
MYPKGLGNRNGQGMFVIGCTVGFAVFNSSG